MPGRHGERVVVLREFGRGLLHELQRVGIERQCAFGPRLRRLVLRLLLLRRHQPAEEGVLRDLLGIGDHLIGILSKAHRLHDALLLGRGIVQLHQPANVAKVVVSPVLLLDEHLENAKVPTNLGVHRRAQQVVNLRLVLLAIPVDAPVALLERNERPRDVEVHHAVTEVVQVDALGGSVRSEQDPNLAGLRPKLLHQVLLLRVVEAAVEHGHRVGSEALRFAELFPQHLEGGNALGEDHHARVVRSDPHVAKESDQLLELRHLRRSNLFREGSDFREQRSVVSNFLRRRLTRFEPKRLVLESLVDGLNQRIR